MSGSSLAFGDTALGENLLFSRLHYCFLQKWILSVQQRKYSCSYTCMRSQCIEMKDFSHYLATRNYAVPPASWKHHSRHSENPEKHQLVFFLICTNLQKSWGLSFLFRIYTGDRNRFDSITLSNNKKIKIFLHPFFFFTLEASLRVQAVKEVNFLSSEKDSDI